MQVEFRQGKTRSMSRLRLPALAVLAVCLSPAAAAQTGAIRGPVSGVVFDGAARALRPVIGVPGAAYLGAPLAAGVDFASVAPDGRRALAVSRGTVYYVRGLDTGVPRWRILEQRASADRAAWSPDSGTVAVWSAESGRLRLWRGLGDGTAAALYRETRGSRFRTLGRGAPGAPRLEELGAVDGVLSALAVDGRGGVFCAVPGGVYRAGAGGPASLIVRVEDPVALAVSDSALFVADRRSGEILEIREAEGGGPDVRLFAGPGRGIDDPAALAVVDGGRTLVVAEARTERLKFFDTATGAQTGEIEAAVRPTRLLPLGERLLLLNDRRKANDTLYVLDRAGPPAVYFIPAGSAAVSATPVED